MIGRCPKCGEILYNKGRFYGCTHHAKHDLDERAAVKEFDGGKARKAAEIETMQQRGLSIDKQ